jgi:peptide/nickel transport system permease protein
MSNKDAISDMQQTPASVTNIDLPVHKRRSLWRRFSRSRVAVVGVVIISVLLLAAGFANLVAPYNPDEINLNVRLQASSASHLFGTDQLGRDVLSRAIYAGRVSLTVAIVAVMIIVTLGILVGSMAGFFGGILDTILMRFTDVVMSFPTFFLVLGIIAIFGRSIPIMIMVLGVTSWPSTARVVRGQFLSLRERDFVSAERVGGASNLRIIFRHILPNVVGPILVIATLQVAWTILAEVGLSFIGLGVQPPTASLGNIVADGRAYLYEAPWITLFPGGLIFLYVMSFNVIGDALRDAIDPKMDVR